MFGIVPKTIWQKTNPADNNNLCTLAMRCLLNENGDRLILVDTGIGDKQDDKFFNHYYLHGEHSLIGSINRAGFSSDEITDVFLTHLHFDHCGGAISRNKKKHQKLEPTFKNARYWSNRPHWKWATNPNSRERGSFLKENILPIQESGQLHFIDLNRPSPFEEFDIFTVDGHTDKQMLIKIPTGDRVIVYVADLLPTSSHIPIPYVMSYDTRPLLTVDEKILFLNQTVEKEYILFFEHDPQIECCTLKETEKGVRMDRNFNLNEIL